MVLGMIGTARHGTKRSLGPGRLRTFLSDRSSSFLPNYTSRRLPHLLLSQTHKA